MARAMQQNELQMLRMSLQVAQANFQAEVELRQKIEGKIGKIVSELVAMAYLLIGPELAATSSRNGQSLRDMEAVEMVRLVKMQAYEKVTKPQTGSDEEAMVGVPTDEASSRALGPVAQGPGACRGVAELERQLLALEEVNKGLGEELTREQQRVEALDRELERMRVTMAMQAPTQKPLDIFEEEKEVLEETGIDDKKKETQPGIWIIGETTVEVNPDLEAEAQALLSLGQNPPSLGRRTKGTKGLLETKALHNKASRALIELLGEGTVCRRTEVARILEKRGVGSGGTIKRGVKGAIEENLIEVVKPETEIRGRATHLLNLTPLGLAVAKHLLGRDPARPLLDRLVACHKSPEHILLNLEAADLLRALGGTVNLFPLPVKLKHGGTLAVDLVWQYDGEIRYVECERETYKNPPQRKNKWRNLYQVTRDFWIVVPTPSAQDALKNELIVWGVTQDHWFNLHLTNLSEATIDDPWLYERKTGRPPKRK